MGKINIHQVTFSYNEKIIFSNLTFTIDTRWKLGLIGRNGRGKTTLLKLLHGELLPEKGEITMTVNTEYFPYQYSGEYSITMDVIKECIANLRTLEKSLDNPEILEQYMALDGFAMEGKIRREFKRMRLKESLLGRPFDTLSGGEKTKILLIALFLKKDTFVLLDEPTNHLDVQGKQEVLEYLNKKNGFILVSHEDQLLDAAVDHILALNKSNVTLEKGNYSTWKRNFEMKEEFELRTKKKLIKEIEKLEEHVGVKRSWADVANTQKYHFASNSRTNGVQSYMRQAKRAEKRIEKDILYKKQLLQNMEQQKQLDFSQTEAKADCLLKVNGLNFSYQAGEPLLTDISFELKLHDALWIRGINGSGKTTLLKLLANRQAMPQLWYNPEVDFSMLMQEPVMPKGMTGCEFLKLDQSEYEYKESLRLCDLFDISDELLEKDCGLYSEGERKKVCFSKILSKKNNVILLDEPLNYMDLMFKEQLKNAILEIRPTMIFIEHDIDFGAEIATSVIYL